MRKTLLIPAFLVVSNIGIPAASGSAMTFQDIAPTVPSAGFAPNGKTATARPQITSVQYRKRKQPVASVELPEAELRKLAVKKVTPDFVYPDYAARIIGNVRVRVRVNPSGKVFGIQFLDGPSLLRTTVIQSARRWEFLPPLQDGKSVRVSGILTFRFEVSGAVKQD
jgi:TonB family protein